jgi:imidazole glycerol-phosphate synthase subunit HisH
MSKVVVIDYGMGNLHSIAKALQHTSTRSTVEVSSDPKTILTADRVVFPGVGAMRDCMQALHDNGLVDVIMEASRTKPMLGICLGMQALLSDSEEGGKIPCLDVIKGHVLRFKAPLEDAEGHVLKIPHMGWNGVHFQPHPLWKNIEQDTRFYFVHSYYAQPENAAESLATTAYPTPFTCAIGRDNLFAVQFHPEKSQHAGLKLLSNFLAWDGTV